MVGYTKIQDGKRIYWLPGVPVDAGEVELEPKNNLEDMISALESVMPANASREMKERARNIIELYTGRRVDATSVLMYAVQKGQFNKYAQRLEDKYEEDIKFMHSDIRFARIDVTAFFLAQFLELGVAKEEDVRSTINLVKKNRAGLVVVPNK